MVKALFIPLKTEYYEAFKSGTKTEELRIYGPRWNYETCKTGREVILSKGYGKQNRMKGVIWAFYKQYGELFDYTHRKQILAVYGTLDIDIAYILILQLEPVLSNITMMSTNV